MTLSVTGIEHLNTFGASFLERRRTHMPCSNWIPHLRMELGRHSTRPAQKIESWDVVLFGGIVKLNRNRINSSKKNKIFIMKMSSAPLINRLLSIILAVQRLFVCSFSLSPFVWLIANCNFNPHNAIAGHRKSQKHTHTQHHYSWLRSYWSLSELRRSRWKCNNSVLGVHSLRVSQ